MPERINLFEVGPRDGLQNEARDIPVAEKIALVNLLSKSGLRSIECASFVSPKWVPQMAGSAQVLQGITRNPQVQYAALTPNMRGLEDAIAAKADEVAIFASASEGFSRANINVSIAESLDRYRPVIAAAEAAGLRTRGYVSCVIACPFDGPTGPAQVARVASALREMGCYEISLGDTIGVGTPDTIETMLNAVLDTANATQFAGHFHNTNGRALDNIDVAITLGLTTFDTAVGGLGGCPYAPGASGNVATEDVMLHIEACGLAHGLNPDIIQKAAVMAKTMQGTRDV